MRHFSLEQWADFARDVVGEEKKAAMQAHLESGCKPCADIHREWSHVREVAGREGAYRPPESAVRTVKGMGAIHARPAKSGIARLLFDSSRSPVAAGVRSASTIARQLLYGVGSYRIDVRMEPQMDSDKVSLVGQVLNSAEPAKHVGDVPVALLKGRKVVGESQTNAFGEFHLECGLEGRLELRFILPQGMEVRIPLVEPAKGSFAGDLEAVESGKVKRNMSRGRQSTRKRVS
ncbi:MAG: hypothetical protein ACYDCD_05420 [Candidatus Acidiferrales bacterium]